MVKSRRPIPVRIPSDRWRTQHSKQLERWRIRNPVYLCIMSGQTHQRFTFSALLRLTRFWNLAVIGFAQYGTACLLIDLQNIFDWRLFLLSASTICIAAAGYIINDYYDVKIDLINKPDRVVIGKNIPRRYAIFFHTLLSIVGVGLGFVLGWRTGMINFFSAFILWWYSNNLKRQPFVGNLTVAFLTGLSIEMINVLYNMNQELVTIYAVFAFFMTLIREIIKDIEDLKGDNTFGCQTLPIVWGIRRTKGLIYFLLVTFGTIVFILNRFLIGLPMYYFFVFFFLPLGWLWLKLIRADTTKDFSRLSTFCKIIMILGILSMIFV
jgi:4-hydroxybenzoate polyprenyltransferase